MGSLPTAVRSNFARIERVYPSSLIVPLIQRRPKASQSPEHSGMNLEKHPPSFYRMETNMSINRSILTFVKSNPESSYSDVAKAHPQIKPNNVAMRLKRFVDQGKLTRRNAAGSYKYYDRSYGQAAPLPMQNVTVAPVLKRTITASTDEAFHDMVTRYGHLGYTIQGPSARFEAA